MFSGARVAIACALAVAVIVPVSALRLIAQPSGEKQTAGDHAKAEAESRRRGHGHAGVEAIGDYFLAKLGKYDKRADRLTAHAEERRGPVRARCTTSITPTVTPKPRRPSGSPRTAATAGHVALQRGLLLRPPRRRRPLAAGSLTAGHRRGLGRHRPDRRGLGLRSDPLRSPLRAVVRDVDSADVAHARSADRDAPSSRCEELQGEKDEVVNGEDWYDVGQDLLRLRKLDESINAFQSPSTPANKLGASTYNIACAYSLRATSATAWLAREG